MRRRDLARVLCARLLAVLIVAWCTSPAANAQSYTFTHFAGPDGGAEHVDASGTSARLAAPWGIVADAAGNLYVAERCIRKITPAGVVTTLAGDCDGGSADDGSGGSAGFGSPYQLAIDGSGNLYVADGNSHLIRKVTPAGVVTTFAGTRWMQGTVDGPALSARFNWPAGIAVDGSGNVYVADRVGQVIRKISGGVVSTIAGSAGVTGTSDSPARFNDPVGLAVDASGNVYVADSRNYSIRRITPAGVVTTFAGQSGTPGTADGAGSAARFLEPSGISIDGSGNLWVADAYHTIRMITPAGVVTTFAGGPRGEADGVGTAAEFLGPRGVVKAPDGNLYVAEVLGDRIRRITPAGVVSAFVGKPSADGHVDASGFAARFKTPSGIDVDAAGNLYVADRYSFTIRKVTPAGAVSTLAGMPGSTGSDDGAGGRFDNPISVALDAAGNVYVAEYYDHTIRKVTPAGVISTLAGTAGSFGTANGTGSAARFRNPVDLAVDSSGNVFVSDQANHTIRKITPAGVVTTFAGTGGVAGSTDATGTSARFNTPAGIARDASNNLYVADRENHTVRKITTAGVVTTFAGSAGVLGYQDGPGPDARFYQPEFLSVDASGNVFVIEGNSSRLRKITPAGVVTTVAGGTGYLKREGTGAFASFKSSAGIAIGPTGTIYISDDAAHSIMRGLPALSAQATIDAAEGPLFVARQLGASPASGTAYSWTQVRRPSGSSAALSSTTVANPTFTPDKPDLYVFRLDASNSASSTRSITFVKLKAQCSSMTVGPASLPDAIAGSPYSATFSAGGGTGPYTFSVPTGYLAGGFSLSTAGSLSGNPPAGTYGFTIRATDSVGCSAERYYSFRIYPYPAPTGLVADGGNASAVFLTWTAVPGAAGYRIYRRSPGEWYTLVGEQPGPSHSDFFVSPNKAYAYLVRARDGSGNETQDSNFDIATTVAFVDAALAGVPVKGQHVLQVRQAINALRDLAGFGPVAFTDASLTGVRVKGIHLAELRTELNLARGYLGVPSIAFTDDPLGSARPIKAIHINQLRNGVK